MYVQFFGHVLEIFGLILDLASTNEYFSIQLWIKIHNFLQIFTLLWCELVVQKPSDCWAFYSKIIWHFILKFNKFFVVNPRVETFWRVLPFHQRLCFVFLHNLLNSVNFLWCLLKLLFIESPLNFLSFRSVILLVAGLVLWIFETVNTSSVQFGVNRFSKSSFFLRVRTL